MNKWKWRSLSKACVLALIFLSGLVVVQLWRNQNAWDVIFVYWCVLTGKNVCDWLGRP